MLGSTIVTCAIAVGLGDAAYAQGSKNKEPPPEEKKSYTMPYFFSGLAVLIIVTPLCWPALRRWDIPVKEE